LCVCVWVHRIILKKKIQLLATTLYAVEKKLALVPKKLQRGKGATISSQMFGKVWRFWLPSSCRMTKVWLSAKTNSNVKSSFQELSKTYPHFFHIFFSFFFFSELGTEPRALRLLGKRSTTELNPQPHLLSWLLLTGSGAQEGQRRWKAAMQCLDGRGIWCCFGPIRAFADGARRPILSQFIPHATSSFLQKVGWSGRAQPRPVEPLLLCSNLLALVALFHSGGEFVFWCLHRVHFLLKSV